MKTRAKLIERLKSGEHPEIVIIGGGVNGAGVFRDLSLQGIPTLLLEKGDYSSGTSASPSRLAHGGLRYLETGEVSLVRESTEERNLMLLNAPHQVRPLPVWIPLWSWLGGTIGAIFRFLRLKKNPGAKGAFPVRAGLFLYDQFGNLNRTMPKHSMLSRSEARQLLPQLAPRTKAVAQYFDALISQPERIVLEMIEDSEEDCAEAMALSYVEALGIRDGALTVLDCMTGEEFTIKPKLVLNIAGAWADEVQKGLRFNRKMVGGTKGSHIVVRNADLATALDRRMLYFETEDFRACLIYPMGEDRLFIGATDIRTDDPNDLRCSDEEIDYLFATMTQAMPEVRFSRDDIVFTVAGVRPLPHSDSDVTGSISRDHKLHQFAATSDRPFPVFTLIGGKWTTYRICAEQISNAVLAHLGQERIASTTRLAIGGGRDYPVDFAGQALWAKELARKSGISQSRAELLAYRYGTRASPIAEAEAVAKSGYIDGAEHYSVAEITWICEHERVTRLEDIVLRRTLMAFEGMVTMKGLKEIAAIMRPILGWTARQGENEVMSTAELLRDRHRMRITA